MTAAWTRPPSVAMLDTVTTKPAPTAPPAPTPDLPEELTGALGTRHRIGITYAVFPGFRPLLLDLCVPPSSTGQPPVVVHLHGGGWRQGTRGQLGPQYADWSPTPFELIAAEGFAVASIDYRLSGESTWPAQLEDVAAAIRWLRAHATELGIATDRMALWGESAGGHLAAMAGLLAQDPTRGAGAVDAVVDWYGPSELLLLDPDTDDSREAMLLGAAASTVPGRATDASPVHHVSTHAPPFLLLHGTADRFVPVGQSELLAAALRGCGVPVELELVDGADHMWLGDEAVARRVFARTVDFLREHLTAPQGRLADDQIDR